MNRSRSADGMTKDETRRFVAEARRRLAGGERFSD
jgi:hypothetical protein